MTRTHTFWTIAALAAAVAGCTSKSEKVGAVLHDPGALARFDGVAAAKAPGIRSYLAVANERGDELRLIDVADQKLVDSPGLVFPLAVPTTGRPLWLSAAGLADGGADALVAIAPGTETLDLVDTWTGAPTVVAHAALPAGAEVISLGAVQVPDAATGAAIPGRARFVVGLAGGTLAVYEVARVAGAITVTPAVTPGFAGTVVPLSLEYATNARFDAGSFSQGADPRVVYAATRDLLPGGTIGVHGVARIALPADLSAWSAATSVTALDALVPTTDVAAIRSSGHAYWTGDDVVLAVPDAAYCGEPPKPIRCGLLALDPATNQLVPAPATVPGAGQPLLPITLPAPVLQLAAAGRTAALGPFTMVSNAGTVATSALAMVAAADGRVYPVDVEHWTLVSDTNEVVGTGRTRASNAVEYPGTASRIGLRSFDGATVSARTADLPARVRVTPGFTPDESWTLSWQGTLPELTSRGAVLSSNGAAAQLAVQIGVGATAVSVADLTALGVQAGDTATLEAGTGPCPAGTELKVASFEAPSTAYPSGRVVFGGTLPACLSSAIADVPESVTFRAGEFLLAGASTGWIAHAGPGTASIVPGRRLFYVADPCTSSECVANWITPFGLTFPYPTGPAVELTAAFVDAKGLATSVAPSRGTSVTFRTESGLVPSGRRPTVSGSALAAVLPTGLAAWDQGAIGGGMTVTESYSAGMVLIFFTESSPGTMNVIR